MDYAKLSDKIQAQEFGTVFQIVGDDVETIERLYAPNAWHDEDNDVEIEATQMGFDDWACMTGLTGQYGYHGAVLHASEVMSEGVARRMVELDESGAHAFTLVPVEVWPEDGDEEPEPAGWTIAYREL